MPTRSNSRQLAAPVERELARLGWTVEPRTGRSEQVAVVRVEQGMRESVRGAPASAIGVGVGGGSYGRHSGGDVGVGVGGTIPIGGGSRQIVGTELSVRIQRRSDATVAWEGRARMEARGNSPIWPAGRPPSTGSPRPCFGTSPESRGALSGSANPSDFPKDKS